MEAVGNADYYVQIEHCRFVPRIRRANNGLDATGTRSPKVEITGWFAGHNANCAGALGKMSCPSCCRSVLVSKTCLDARHVKIAEMEEIQILSNVEIAPFHSMETTSPTHGRGYHRRFCVSGAKQSIVTLRKESFSVTNVALCRAGISILAEELSHIDSETGQTDINLLRRKILPKRHPASWVHDQEFIRIRPDYKVILFQKLNCLT